MEYQLKYTHYILFDVVVSLVPKNYNENRNDDEVTQR